MNIDVLVTRLGTVTQLGQVITALPGGSISPFDTGTALYTLLTTSVSPTPTVFAVTMKDRQVTPSIVYQLVSSTPSHVNGFRVIQTDTYVLYVRHTSYDSLISLVNSVITAIDSSTNNIEMTDFMFDYEPEQKIFRCSLEIEFSYITAAAQTLPAAFVFCLQRAAADFNAEHKVELSTYDNYTKQPIINQYGIIVVNKTDSSPVVTMDSVLNGIKSKLLGWQQDTTFFPFEYLSGASVEGIGGMEIWREIYKDAEYFTQA